MQVAPFEVCPLVSTPDEGQIQQKGHGPLQKTIAGDWVVVNLEVEQQGNKTFAHHVFLLLVCGFWGKSVAVGLWGSAPLFKISTRLSLE